MSAPACVALLLVVSVLRVVFVLCDLLLNVYVVSCCVCCISGRFSEDGLQLSVGCNDSKILLFDVHAQKKLRAMDGHNMRVSSLAWSGVIMASGSR